MRIALNDFCSKMETKFDALEALEALEAQGNTLASKKNQELEALVAKQKKALEKKTKILNSINKAMAIQVDEDSDEGDSDVAVPDEGETPTPNDGSSGRVPPPRGKGKRGRGSS